MPKPAPVPDILGTEGPDLLIGTGSDEFIYALGGNDTLVGGGGNDTLDGGDGSDDYLVTGFEGTDAYSDSGADGGHDRIVAGADGTVIIMSLFSGIEEVTADGFSGVNIRGSVNSDFLDFSGTDLVGIDYIHGMNGQDTIIGSQGDDMIYGGLGDDVLDGQAGDDILNGGYGADEMTGGAGADTFVLIGLTAPGDTITDFTSGEDLIDMTSITGNSGYVGYELIGVKGGKDTVIRVEISDGVFNDMAVLEGVSPEDLNASDFLI